VIETEQTALVEADIAAVWAYVRDIARWAEIMPGYRECEIIDDDASRWTLKVGVGGLVRTVKVAVHVDEWSGPDLVHFSYQLTGDPVRGGGTYRATPRGPRQTEIALRVRVEGSGPMAPMWEAMGKPLLPQFARDFANQLKREIEKVSAVAPGQAEEVARASGLRALPQFLWKALCSLGRRKLSAGDGEFKEKPR
jgi:carbon monoxide dehydrogenase subunit G